MKDSDPVGTTALRKVSWRLLPLLFLGYAIANIDRLNISFAALQMNQDLHFSATIYGIGGGLFFLSYSAFEVPSNLMLLHFGPRRWFARIMITWGLIAAGMMFVRTPIQFYIMRFLLGAAEAGYANSAFYYLTLWFPASYRGRATSRFYVAFPFSGAVMAALATPLLSLDGHLGLAGWQWLFLIEGAPAVLLGGVILLRLSDSPTDARWLTETEKAWLHNRLSAEKKALGEHGDPGYARALLDRRVWLLGLSNVCIMGALYSFGLSAPSVLKSATHWSTAQVGLLMSGTALLGGLCMLFNGAHSDGRFERYLHTALPYCLVATAFLSMGITVIPRVFVLAYVVYYACHAAGQASFLLIPSDFLHGRSAAGGIAAVISIGQMGAFFGPIAWGIAKDHTGSYQVGLLSISVSIAGAVALLLLVRHTARLATRSMSETIKPFGS